MMVMVCQFQASYCLNVLVFATSSRLVVCLLSVFRATGQQMCWIALVSGALRSFMLAVSTSLARSFLDVSGRAALTDLIISLVSSHVVLTLYDVMYFCKCCFKVFVFKLSLKWKLTLHFMLLFSKILVQYQT